MRSYGGFIRIMEIHDGTFILCKESAIERNENLFSNSRMQPFLCKDNDIF
ncbi:hypothetical protein HMPREF3034_00877 [Prevotella sp. DNF00663]|nr:hypothetical protein HMPREF3034_00877 [Prevotella sp. DNF00663]